MIHPSQFTKILNWLEQAGVPYHLGGGWGIDALIGEVTREHADIDVYIPVDFFEQARALFEEKKFLPTIDWLPARLAMTHADGREIDLHPIELQADDSALFRYPEGVLEIPSTAFVTRTLLGCTVPCWSADFQIQVHLGYTPTQKDKDDIQKLCQKIGKKSPL